MDTSALTEPGQTQPTLEAIHRTINAVDPHFRYDFRVDTLEMDADGKPIMPTIHDSPGLVAAISSAGADGIAVTFSVFARFKEATSERPVPGQFTLVAEPGVRQPTPHRYSTPRSSCCLVLSLSPPRPHDRRSMRRFEASPRRATPKGQPSSAAQHRHDPRSPTHRGLLRSWHTRF